MQETRDGELVVMHDLASLTEASRASALNVDFLQRWAETAIPSPSLSVAVQLPSLALLRHRFPPWPPRYLSPLPCASCTASRRGANPRLNLKVYLSMPPLPVGDAPLYRPLVPLSCVILPPMLHSLTQTAFRNLSHPHHAVFQPFGKPEGTFQA